MPYVPTDIKIRVSQIQKRFASLFGFLPEKDQEQKVLTEVIGNEVYNTDVFLSNTLNEMFVHKARLESSIIDHGISEGLSRKDEVSATGSITFTGVVGTTIPISPVVLLANESNVQYQLTSAVEIQAFSALITSIQRTAGEVSITTQSKNYLTSNVKVNIVGCGSFNVTQQDITSTGDSSFTFSQAGADESFSPTALSLAVYTIGIGSVLCLKSGVTGNMLHNSKISLASPITNINNDAFVNSSAISGGADIEDIAVFQSRIWDFKRSYLSRTQNADLIKAFIFANTEATKCWVYAASTNAEAGTLRIIVANNAGTLFPQSSLDSIKSLVYNYIAKPVVMEGNVFVENIYKENISVIITSLTPATSGMYTAVKNNIIDLFNEMNIKRFQSASEFSTQSIERTVLATEYLGASPIFATLSIFPQVLTLDNSIPNLSSLTINGTPV